VAGVAEALIQLRTLTDGGQPPEPTAEALAAFVAAAERTLEIAIYDLHLPSPLAETVRGAFVAAHDRGVAVRLAFNVDHPWLEASAAEPPTPGLDSGRLRRPGAVPVPAPPSTDPGAMDDAPFRTAPISGIPDLMHHKYIVRDGSSVWTGSTNWTADSWTREENVIVTLDSPELAARYLQDFEQLWSTREVRHSGRVDTSSLQIGATPVRPWFCPGRGDKVAHRIAKAIGSAQRRVRIASPVISSGPILGTLAQVASDGKVDLAGVVDLTQIREVLYQWKQNGNAEWKEPLLRTSLTRAPFSGKVSTPYAAGSLHDYMHAKVTVADDVVFVGSFNLSHSGELNAENVLEIADAGLADRLAAFIDEVRGKYAPVAL
jgi:phosphatidylserine/phosphatidylglycerophosphate/cardiolipin synthase-like enzyme